MVIDKYNTTDEAAKQIESHVQLTPVERGLHYHGRFFAINEEGQESEGSEEVGFSRPDSGNGGANKIQFSISTLLIYFLLSSFKFMGQFEFR